MCFAVGEHDLFVLKKLNNNCTVFTITNAMDLEVDLPTTSPGLGVVGV